MITIRNEQLRAFQEADRARFIRQTVAMVRDCYAEEAGALCGDPLDLGALSELVTALVSAAKDYGLDDEADVERFVELSFDHGPGFEASPDLAWAGAILKGPGSSTAKIARIDGRLESED